MNEGSSPYHNIGALFCRGSHGELLSVEGRSADQISRHWSQIRNLVATGSQTSTTLPSGTEVNVTTIDTSKIDGLQICAISTSHIHMVRELSRPGKTHHIGLISCNIVQDAGGRDPFHDWLESFILLETSLRPSDYTYNLQDTKALHITENIVSIFVATLKNIASKDEWDMGSSLFKRRVLDFVVRDERIQMALPAFPCKSPSSRKVGGVGPDMAERVALRTLRTFARDVSTIYSPGVSIWIVSDGHVFSDCSK
jgi:hypothetical protein